MPGITVAASILITLALIFYSLGVWAEHLARYLKGWHVVAFWTGFLFDTSGTLAMELIQPGFDWASSHTITGQIALWLMLGHAIWATRVVRKGSERYPGGRSGDSRRQFPQVQRCGVGDLADPLYRRDVPWDGCVKQPLLPRASASGTHVPSPHCCVFGRVRP